jgi:ethanolamine utilization protein EutQ
MQKRLITADDIRKASSSGQKSLLVPSDECIVTPMARDEAIALDVLLSEKPETTSADCDCPAVSQAAKQEIQSDELIKTVSELLQARGASDVPAHQLETVVREVISSKLGSAGDQNSLAEAPSAGAKQGIRFIQADLLLKQDGGLTAVPEKMFVATAVGDKKGEKLAGGYMTWENATFSRSVEAAEIAVVIEGELHLIVDGETMVSQPGDMIYFPKGAVVDYHAPGKVKLACVNCL